MSKFTSENKAIEKAANFLTEHYTTVSMMCGVIGCSSAYVYRSCNDGFFSLRTALKVEVLINEISSKNPELAIKHFGDDNLPTWREFSPEENDTVHSVLNRA